jgi:RNA polymerase sigma-70 factor (ECF subfamily)
VSWGRTEERSDAELIAAVRDRDSGALAALYQRHAPWLTVRLTRRCADADIVDQAVQDTFVAIWRKPASFHGTGEPAAWIWGIGIRRLIDQLRHQRRRVDTTAIGDLQVAAEDEVLLGVEHGDLGGAIERLSPELRAVVQATVLDGLTTREAGRLLNVPTGTVKTRMARARVQMREALT